MKFSELIGQEHAGNSLNNSIASGRLAHAYLFAYIWTEWAKEPVRRFSPALNALKAEKNPAISALHVQRNSIQTFASWSRKGILRIEQIREMQNSVVYKPYEGKWKVYILEDADKLTEAAANSLLKTLERAAASDNLHSPDSKTRTYFANHPLPLPTGQF